MECYAVQIYEIRNYSTFLVPPETAASWQTWRLVGENLELDREDWLLYGFFQKYFLYDHQGTLVRRFQLALKRGLIMQQSANMQMRESLEQNLKTLVMVGINLA